MRKLWLLFLCLVFGLCVAATPASADILKYGLNGMWFENVELVFDAEGNEVSWVQDFVLYPDTNGYRPIGVGDYFAGILSVQGVRIDADPYHWNVDTYNDELTGVFANKIEAIETGIDWYSAGPDGIYGTADDIIHVGGARITMGAPTITTFNANDGSSFSTGLTGDEMFALYRDVNPAPTTGTPYEFNGTVGQDVFNATDGDLWATFGHGDGADNVWGTNDDTGYAYSYSQALGLPAQNFGGEGWYALNAIQNNTGWIFPGDLNDPDESELGGPGGIIAGLLNDMYMNSEFTSNPFWVDGYSPWVFQSNDPAYISAVPEPATMLLLGSGLVGLAGFARRRRSKKVS